MNYLILKLNENRSTNKTVGVIQSIVPSFLAWLLKPSFMQGPILPQKLANFLNRPQADKAVTMAQKKTKHFFKQLWRL